MRHSEALTASAVLQPCLRMDVGFRNRLTLVSVCNPAKSHHVSSAAEILDRYYTKLLIDLRRRRRRSLLVKIEGDPLNTGGGGGGGGSLYSWC